MNHERHGFNVKTRYALMLRKRLPNSAPRMRLWLHSLSTAAPVDGLACHASVVDACGWRDETMSEPKPVESAVRKPEEVFYKDEISINGVGGSWEEVQRVLRSWELEIRAERDAYWRGQLDITKREALEFSRAQGDANRELRRRLAEVLGEDDE